MPASKILAVTAALGISASALLTVAVPAQAAPQKTGIGSGRALIHIDAPTATVTKTGKNSYRMVLPPDSTGQWMGERTDAKGNKQTRVGDINAKKLSKKWGKFRYTDAAVPATLAWAASDGMSSALVKLSQPTITDAGVRFDFTSPFKIPSTLTDVSMNLQRAPERSPARSSSSTTPCSTSTDATNFQISGDLCIGANVVADDEINSRIYNDTNNNTCWTGSGAKTMTEGEGASVYSVTSNDCANVAYENQHAASGSASAYGAWVDWPYEKKGNSYPGKLTYYLNVTPSGASQFTFTHQVMSW